MWRNCISQDSVKGRWHTKGLRRILWLCYLLMCVCVRIGRTKEEGNGLVTVRRRKKTERFTWPTQSCCCKKGASQLENAASIYPLCCGYWGTNSSASLYHLTLVSCQYSLPLVKPNWKPESQVAWWWIQPSGARHKVEDCGKYT